MMGSQLSDKIKVEKNYTKQKRSNYMRLIVFAQKPEVDGAFV